MAETKDLRQNKRFITSHDVNGKEIFDNSIPEDVPYRRLPDGAHFGLCYATNQFPADLSSDKDIKAYSNYLTDLPGITISTGSVVRIVDMMPGALSPMHRTISIDYGVVLEGEVELVLDSGEKRLMKRGDISVQRGTNHAWRNATKTDGAGTGWARMLYVLLPVEKLEVGGTVLGEDTSTIPGVKPSD